ncbi:unnamed protein product [Pedinophyceae sp. YPF-701]|nr:unnamed protein product [Pedinophyceae sp. YPF-701]
MGFKVNILIPMAGEGSRFRKEGFLQPKPVIDVGGRPMIDWVLGNVIPGSSIDLEPTFIVIIRRAHDELYGIKEKLLAIRPDIRVCFAEELTEGAACTTLLAKSEIDNSDPLFIINSDQFIEWDVDAFWRQVMQEQDSKQGNILCFEIPMEKNDVKWSYAKLDADNHVVDVQEKKVISTHATVGAYYWRRGADYVACAEEMIRRDIRVNGEFYVAPVYNIGVERGMKFTISDCERMWGLGVPNDLSVFLSEYLRPRRSKDASLLTARSDVGKVTADAASELDNLRRLRYIAHRGNVNGKDVPSENDPAYIMKALNAGFDVEVDVWYDPAQKKWMLGHDEPEYEVPFDFLLNKRFWLHCKNAEALRVLAGDPRVTCFFHDVDEFTLTSKGHVWIYPDKPLLGPNSIAVMFSEPSKLLGQPLLGICADNVGELRAQAEARINTLLNPAGRPSAPLPSLPPVDKRVKLVVFDLDGVLVESKDLHYDALNDALAHVAGPDFVIGRAEHESVYDGLSTNQKLRILTAQKGLPVDLHNEVWQYKQERTQELFRQQIRVDKDIQDTIIALKQCGFPVAVASNCIRSSVSSLLEAIGVLHLVDAFFSNEDVPSAKPAPDIYLKAAKSFSVPPSSVAVVEDSVKGFESVVRAGCNLLRVEGPHDVRASKLLPRIFEVEKQFDTHVNVVFPLAGSHVQYWLKGPERLPEGVPVYLADVGGKPLIEWVVESVNNSGRKVHFTFIVPAVEAEAFSLPSLLSRATNFAPTTVLTLSAPTLGAAKTVLRAKHLVDNDRPLLICDGGHVLRWEKDVGDILNCSGDGAVTVCEGTDPRWSYVQLAPARDTVELIREKAPISNLACTGTYFWKRGADFVAAAESMIAKNTRVRGGFFIAPVYNEAIEKGKNIKIVGVQRCWHVRGLSEVRSFAKEVITAGAAKQLDGVYEEMRERNSRKIAEKGYGHDEKLRGEDGRRCLAVYTLAGADNFSGGASFGDLVADLTNALGSNQVIYTAEERPGALCARLHFTFMQLVTFSMYAGCPTDEEYREAVEAILISNLPSFEVRFDRLICTPGNLLLTGYPTADLNNVRETVRKEMARAGLPLFEPYKVDIMHMTLARFANPVSDAQKAALDQIIDKYSGAKLATLRVNELKISPASWKMQHAELAMHAAETSHVVLQG